jgi:hypothetical protein
MSRNSDLDQENGFSRRVRSSCGGEREARAGFKLSEDLCGHFKLSCQGDGIADSMRGAEALELPASAPQDALHSHVDDADDHGYAV